MINEQKIKQHLELINNLGYPAIAAGSHVYLDEGNPSDLDIYINFDGKDLKSLDNDLLDQLTMEGDYVLLDKTNEEVAALKKTDYSKACHWLKAVKYLKYEDGTVINLMVTQKIPNEANNFGFNVIRQFDYGRIMIFYAHIFGLSYTEEYIKDKTEKLLTLYNVPSKYHMSIMDQRASKLQDRFPDHKLRFADGWYKPDQKSKVTSLYDNPWTTGGATYIPIGAYREGNNIYANDVVNVRDDAFNWANIGYGNPRGG